MLMAPTLDKFGAARQATVASLGSIGDLLPLLAVGKALENSGVDVTVAANPIYRESIESQGLAFRPLGEAHDPTDFRRLEDISDASSFVQHVNFTQLNRLFDELLAMSHDADVIVANYLVIPAHLVAEKLGIPFVACALSPSHLMPRNRALTGFETQSHRTPAHWQVALAELRKRARLARKIFPYSAILDTSQTLLGLFPHFLLRSLATQYSHLQVTGYPRLQGRNGHADHERIREFCDERTVVFSFGSYVDRSNARYFYEESVAACRSLKLKCLYLSRHVEATAAPSGSDADVLLLPFVDHEQVFAHVELVVHHAGLGTLMSACRHLRPMVCVPFILDQPYHAARMAELIGCAVLPATRFNHETM